MPCCGKQRTNLPQTSQINQTPNAARAESDGSLRVRRDRVYFEYLGDKNITVIGPVSGKRYRFNGPGSFVEVDLRDRRGVAALPLLRQVR